MIVEPQGEGLETPPGTAARSRDTWRTRSLWLVHLGLLLTAAASLATLQMLHVNVDYHTYVGLVFVGLVLVHLAQRRHTLARMASQILHSGKRRLRLSVSDAI